MAISFGVKQRKNPIPKKVSNGLDITAGILGILTTYVGTAPYIPSDITIILSSIFGLLGTISLFLKQFFGVKNPPRRVNVEDVTAMEEPEKDKVDISKFPPSPEPKNKP